MTYRLLADSGCTDGTCPTFWVDETTGDVKVRGYQPEHLDDPSREVDVVIPAAKWATLISKLGR